jgi:hypothetical protein
MGSLAAGAGVVRDAVAGDTAYLSYAVGAPHTATLLPFLEAVEALGDVVRDVAVSQTTLEDVFLQVTADSHVIEALQ